MVNWKQLLLPVFFIATGLILLYGQMLNQWLTFANITSQRIYIVLCTALISIGHGLSKTETSKRVTQGILLFIILNVALLIFGGLTSINDAINATNITGGSGIFIAYDTLSTPFTSKALEFSIIVKTLVGLLPAIIVSFSVISVWISSDPDELQSAILESAIVLAIVIAFSFFGNLFNFAWV